MHVDGPTSVNRTAVPNIPLGEVLEKRPEDGHMLALDGVAERPGIRPDDVQEPQARSLPQDLLADSLRGDSGGLVCFAQM